MSPPRDAAASCTDHVGRYMIQGIAHREAEESAKRRAATKSGLRGNAKSHPNKHHRHPPLPVPKSHAERLEIIKLPPFWANCVE